MKEVILEKDIQNEAERVSSAFKSALNCRPEEFSKRYLEFKEAKARFDEVYEPFKQNLIDLYEKDTELPKSVVVDGVKLTYVSASVRNTIDTKRLKEEEPELAKKFTKTTNVSATMRIDGV